MTREIQETSNLFRQMKILLGISVLVNSTILQVRMDQTAPLEIKQKLNYKRKI